MLKTNLVNSHYVRRQRNRHSSLFQNEGIFVQLDELDELDKFIHA